MTRQTFYNGLSALQRPQGVRQEAAREITLVVAAYLFYTLVKNLINTDAILDAFAHAGAVIMVETALGLFIEASVQAWFLQEADGALRLLTYFYLHGFWAIFVGSAVLFFLLRRHLYYRLRGVFLITMALGVAVFALFPLAPPRMLPSMGFVDAMEHYGMFLPDDSGFSLLTYNQYAAMPSLHYTWALLVAVAWLKYGGRLAAIFGLTFQALILLAIIATANHYVLDAVFGAALIFAAFKIHAWWERRQAEDAEDRKGVRRFAGVDIRKLYNPQREAWVINGPAFDAPATSYGSMAGLY